jgi:hypothetical protein
MQKTRFWFKQRTGLSFSGLAVFIMRPQSKQIGAFEHYSLVVFVLQGIISRRVI